MLVYMPEGVLRRGFRLALWGCVLVVAWLAFTPFVEPPGVSWDKANHALAFCVMAALADAGYPGRKRELPRWGLLLGYGLVIELVQWRLPYREFSWLDLVANVVGVLLYLGLRAWVGWRLLRPRTPRHGRPAVMPRLDVGHHQQGGQKRAVEDIDPHRRAPATPASIARTGVRRHG